MPKYSRKEEYSAPTNLRELLVLAEKREDASIKFYHDIATHSFPVSVKVFINELKKEEIKHKAKIKCKLKQLTREGII